MAFQLSFPPEEVAVTRQLNPLTSMNKEPKLLEGYLVEDVPSVLVIAGVLLIWAGKET